ncbi:hypothetical protein OFY05_23370 (plasmid) [Pseudocitrobacter faecalis]|nr:hypothetical protein OFY05_23370 [Pseudocitrobacter faecalis]
MSEKSRITFASVNQAKLPFNLVLQGNAGTPAGTIKIDKELVTFEVTLMNRRRFLSIIWHAVGASSGETLKNAPMSSTVSWTQWTQQKRLWLPALR